MLNQQPNTPSLLKKSDEISYSSSPVSSNQLIPSQSNPNPPSFSTYPSTSTFHHPQQHQQPASQMNYLQPTVMMTPNSSYSGNHPPPIGCHQQHPDFLYYPPPLPSAHYYPLATPPTSIQLNSSPHHGFNHPSSSVPHSRTSTTVASSPPASSIQLPQQQQQQALPNHHNSNFLSTPNNYQRAPSNLPSSLPNPSRSSMPPFSTFTDPRRASFDSDAASACSYSSSMKQQWSSEQPPKSSSERKESKGSTGGKETKKRRTTTKAENEALTALFNKNAYPDAEARQQVASQTGMTMQMIGIWFANRRMTQRKLSQRYADEQRAHQDYQAGGSFSHSPTPTGTSSDYGSRMEQLETSDEIFVEGIASLYPSSSTPLSAVVNSNRGSGTSGSMTSSAGKRKRITEEQASPLARVGSSKQGIIEDDVFSGPSLHPTLPMARSSSSSSAGPDYPVTALCSSDVDPLPVKPQASSTTGTTGASAVAVGVERCFPTQPWARSLQKSFSTGTNFSLLVTSEGHASVESVASVKGDEENMPVKSLEPSVSSNNDISPPSVSVWKAQDLFESPSKSSQHQDSFQEGPSHAVTPLWKRMQSSNQSSSEGDSPLRDPRGARGEEEDEEITLRKVANRRAAKARAQQEAQAQARLDMNGGSPSSLPATLPSADARSVQSAASIKRPFRHSVPSLDLAAAHDRSLQPLSETMRAPQAKAQPSSHWRPSTTTLTRAVSQPNPISSHPLKRGRPRKPPFELPTLPKKQPKPKAPKAPKQPKQPKQPKKKATSKASVAAVGKGKASGLPRSQSYSTGSQLARPSRSTYMALDSAGEATSSTGLNSRRSVSSTTPFSSRGSLDAYAQSHSRYRPSSSRDSAARTASWSSVPVATWQASSALKKKDLHSSSINLSSLPSSQSSQLSDDWTNDFISDSRTSMLKSSSLPPSSQERATTVNDGSQPKDDSGFFGSDDESEVDETELELDEVDTFPVKENVKHFKTSNPSMTRIPEQQENDHQAAELLLGLGSWGC